MNKNIKITLLVLGVILVGVFVVLATQKPILTEDILIKENKDELETEESNVLVTDEEPEEPEEPEELEELVNEDTEKQEKKDEEVVVVEEEKTINNFIQCLKEKGVIIYGSEWCPYCKSLAESLGGYDVVNPIYVECTVEKERCADELIGRGVPEIQIKGIVYNGSRDPEKIAEETECVYYQ